MMTTAIATLDAVVEMIHAGRLDAAREALEGIPQTDENRIERLFLLGYWQEHSDDRETALSTYLSVLEQEPEHAEAAFRAAWLCDQAGNEDEAVRLYQQCTSRTPAHVNALINLAVLYEEKNKLAEAEACLCSVLTEYPEHSRARHFLKSVKSSYTMVYDEQTQEERERRSAMLDLPISDFELSVRSRNCLRQMNIRSVADLLKTTEAELLSYKNFGETSLNEIKAMLTQKGLRLGQALQAPEPAALQAGGKPAIGEQAALLNRPIAELQLSVRSRKALQRLGITMLGELVQRSEGELLAIKNFGLTSLIEIKRQLEKYGLSFQGVGTYGASEPNDPLHPQ